MEDRLAENALSHPSTQVRKDADMGFGRLILAFLSAITLTVSTHATTTSASAVRHAVLKQRPDPCGFRYGAWPLVQETASYLLDAKVGLDEYAAVLRNNYLSFKMLEVASDYGYPQGWRKVENAQIDVEVGVEFAYTDGKDKGDTDWFNWQMAKVQKAQNQMWRAIKAICAWRGKSQTWTGYLDAYGYQSGITNLFYAPGPWEVDYSFSCPPLTFGGTDVRPGLFSIYVRGGRYDGALAANDVDTQGGDTHNFGHGGAYSLQVLSDCAWHVKITKGY